MSSAGSYGGSGGGGGVGDVKFLTGNSGGPVGPDIASNINVIGTGDVTVVGNAGTNTLTIELTGTIANTYDADSGTATPALGILNINGLDGIITSASGNTIIVETDGTLANIYTTDSGTATPAAGNLNIVGGSGISTSAGGSTITITASGGGGGVTSLKGDTGSAISGVLTITGSTSGASFDTTGTIITESFNFLAMEDSNNPLTTGYISIGGIPILQMSGGVGQDNICLGQTAGNSAMTGAENTLIGAGAGNGLTSASSNVFIGSGAAQIATTSPNNVAIGGSSLFNIGTGLGNNVAIGIVALENLTTGNRNIGIGSLCGNAYNGAESNNILIANPGVNAESNVMRLGSTGSGNNQVNQTFIAGINGVTIASSAAVLMDTATEQLGTVVSSRRYKENIDDMGAVSRDLYKLRPVKFSYKGDQNTSYGLIAEEVEEVMPYLVAYDKEGLPQTVRYHELPALLLNEIKRLRSKIEELEGKFNARVRS